ncbi:MAG: Gfo/Idh/MocA family oxidoreductase [Treponema sp.]|jgi:predicted dehydrogenase|nr:Gfo/Idh/MocA family oxidoreductase [Treponema sp.]
MNAPNDRPLKVCVIGLGRIASLLEDDAKREKPCTHAGAIAANEDCVLCAGADIDGGRRDLFAGRWNVPVYADAEAMLAAERPDIVHIATHPDSHYRYCALAARYGVTTAVCEKPLADTLGKAKKIAALAESGAITVIVNHERRYSADYVEARKLLSDGCLGAILSVRGTLYMGLRRRLLDVLWHDGTHLADAAMFLCGGVLRHRKRWGVPLESRGGSAWLLGTVSGGIPFVLELGAGRDHLVFELSFSCEKGRLRVGNRVFEVWKSAESPYAEGFRSLEKIRGGFGETTGYFSGMLADAVACTRDRGRRPRSGASDALAVIRYLNGVKAWR